MRLSSKTWYAISLLCLAGALYFWWLGNQRARKPGAPPPPPASSPTDTPNSTNAHPPATGAGQPTPPSFRLLSALAPSMPVSAAPSAPPGTGNPPATAPRPAGPSDRLSNTPEPMGRLARRDTAILLGNAALDTARPLALDIPRRLRAREEPGAYVVQSRGPLTDAFRADVGAAGGEIIAYLPNHAYLVRLSAAGAARVAAGGRTQAVLAWEPYYKLEAPLLEAVLGRRPWRDGSLVNVVLFPAGTLPDLGLEVLARDRTPFGPMVTVRASADDLAALARRPEVQTLERHRWRQTANDLTRARLTVATNTATGSNHLGLTGSGVLVNVNDEGVDTGHPDLAPRVYTEPGTGGLATNNPGHGTHVIGTIVSSGVNGPTNAAGTNGGSYRGMASGASVLFMPFAYYTLVDGATNQVQVPDSYLQERAALSNAFISNNSWSYVDNPSYDIHAASFDLAVRDALPGVSNAQPLCLVFSAGNDGGGDTEGTGGSSGTINSPATAKNVITVGAIENRRNLTNQVEVDGTTNAYYLERTDSDNEVTEFSSRGNVGYYEGEGTYGRFKPDVMAPGAMIISTRPRGYAHPDTNIATLDGGLGGSEAAPYGYENGSSMAAAAVSGVLALMQQYFEQEKTLTNSPALMKALLINGARDLKETYDYELRNYINYQGWGLVSLTNSLPEDLTPTPDTPTSLFMADQDPARALATGHTQLWTVTLTSNAQSAPLRVTLVWTDPPGHPSASQVKLVNDLDLVVTEGTNSYVGNNFPLGAAYCAPSDLSSPTNGASLDSLRDVVNNVENVFLEPPLAGAYTIAVIGTHVRVNALMADTNDIVQDFALVVSSDSRTNTGPITVTEGGMSSNVAARVAAMVQLTNGLPFYKQKERVGANPPLTAATNGAVSQWNFYTFEVGPALTNASNAVFVLFHIPYARNLGLARTNEADVDLYVSTDPALTNLSDAVFAGTNLLRGVRRGGYEAVWTSNAPPGTVFYVGVKAEDQQAAEYALVAGLFDSPESGGMGDQPTDLEGYAVDIPDGSPDEPNAGMVIVLNPYPMTIQNVVVTTELTHEFGGDLYGQLTHEANEAVLNNHRGFTGTNVVFLWDDSESLEVPGSLPSDGPPTLRNFAGEEGQGVWVLTMVDNSPSATGRVERLLIQIDPMPPLEHFRNGFGYTASGTIPAAGWDRYTVDVPADATNLTVCLMPDNGPLGLYLRFEQDPTTNTWDHHALVDPGRGCITVVKYDSPPLRQGRYFIGIHNPNVIPVNYQLTVRVERDLRPSLATTYRSSGPTQLLDAAMTNSAIHVPEDEQIASVQVGVRLDHARASDLALYLVSPRGTRLLLSENRGGLSADGYGFSSISSNTFAASEACVTGCNVPKTNVVATSFTEGILTIDFEFYDVPDRMTIYHDGGLIFDSGVISGNGTIEVPFGPGLSTNLLIVMNEQGDSIDGTWWNYTGLAVSGRYIYTTFTENTNLTSTPIKFGIPPFTNNVLMTNLNVPTPVSRFETAGPGPYPAGTTFDGWTVDAGQVEVVADPPWAADGLQFLALAHGSVSRSLPTVPGAAYRLTYAARDPGIAGWWPAEGTPDDLVSTNHGVPSAGMLYAAGLVGQAFQFDGANGHVTIPAAADLDVGLSNGLTIEAWINPLDATAERPLVEWNNGAGVIGAHLWLGPTNGLGAGGPGALYANLVDTAGTHHIIASAPDLVRVGTNGHPYYQHIALTYHRDTGEAVLYLNGAPVCTTNLGAFTPQTAFDLHLGHRPSGGGAPAHYWGDIDEVAVYRRALTRTEIAAIHAVGVPAPPGGKCTFTACLPNATVAVQSAPRTIAGSAGWRTNSLNFTASETATYLDAMGKPLSLLLDTFELTPVRAPAFYLPEEPLSLLRGESTRGDWTLEIWDTRVGAYWTNNALLSWTLQFSIIESNPPAILLNHGECYTFTNLATNAIAYFVVSVPPAASFATNTLLSLTGGGLDLWFNKSSLPTGSTGGDTNSGFVGGGGDILLFARTTNALAILETNQTRLIDVGPGTNWAFDPPRLERSQTYYLAVRNSDPTQTNDFQICLRFDRTGSLASALPLLTNGVGASNCLAAGSDLAYYQFNASSNAESVLFELLNPDGNVDLYVRRGPPVPTTTDYQLGSTNAGSAGEWLQVQDVTFNATAGTWYLGVHNHDTNTVCYAIRATETLGHVVVWLTNEVPHTNLHCVAAGPVPDGIDYYGFHVSTNAVWVSFDVADLSDDVNLILSYERPLPTLAVHDYLSDNPGTNAEQILLLTNSAPVALTNGDWYLGVVHAGLTNTATNCLSYQVRATEHTNEPPHVTPLTNAVALATNLAPGATLYFSFTASSNAVQAHFELQPFADDLDLFIKPGLPLPGPGLFAYAGTNAGTNAEFIAVATNSLPAPLVAPGWPRTNDWFLAVVNTSTNTNAAPAGFAVQVTEYVPVTNALTNLLFVAETGVTYTNTMWTNQGDWNLGGDYYLFDHTNSPSAWALFEVLWSDAPVSLYVADRTLLPTHATNAYFSVNPDLRAEQVLVATNSRPAPWTNGSWFFSVVRNQPLATNLTYAFRVRTFPGAPAAFLDLTNAVPVTNITIAAGDTLFCRFPVSNAAVQAHFEVRDLSANIDLYTRPSSSLPGPANCAYASTNTGTNAEFIAVATNSVPVPLVSPAGHATNDWFLALVNTNAHAVTCSIQASEYVPVAETVTNLLFSVRAGAVYT
ncbi:MAG: S8 family serine peptidase, partial [Verrucomicrobia bacterium]|nr:S8 family serine peptidase [Verrucomicrobiota bacterium]